MESRYVLQKAESINLALDELPIANEEGIQTISGKRIAHKKAIIVNNGVVSVMSKPYKLVQHKEAFRPIIEGLTLRGISDFEFNLWANHRKASLGILVGEATDGVKFGFKCVNSFDGSTAINFGFSAYQKIVEAQIVQKEHVLVWGYRQICSNGMIAKIPLKTCKYLDVEQVTKIKQLLSEHARIIHLGDIEKKLKAVQFVVEAFTLLKNPLDMMIIDAKKHYLSEDDAKELILKYVGKRRIDEYMELYGMEEQTLWGLYNTLTFLASHDSKMKDSKRERLLLKSANMLEAELLEE